MEDLLVLSSVYGVEQLLQLLGGEHPVSEVSVELVERQLPVV